VRIRRAEAGDRDAIYDVCLRTADAGGDASALHVERDLPGDVWAGPYLELRPRLAFVAESHAGVDGYIVGAEDTVAFRADCEAQWWPALRARYVDPPDDCDLTPDLWLHRYIHHPPVPPPEVLAEYPAHLHVNLLPRAQGQGAGRHLLETLFDALTGVPGIHLGVSSGNEGAAAFYTRLGFVPVGPPRAPGAGWLLGRRLATFGADPMEVPD
jgi:ribosomal protein S18 acetylase RimI-like enzyme